MSVSIFEKIDRATTPARKKSNDQVVLDLKQNGGGSFAVSTLTQYVHSFTRLPDLLRVAVVNGYTNTRWANAFWSNLQHLSARQDRRNPLVHAAVWVSAFVAFAEDHDDLTPGVRFSRFWQTPEVHYANKKITRQQACALGLLP